MKEFDIINKHLSKLSKNNPSSLNLNDDVFYYKNKNLVISTDSYNEGIHFIDFKKPVWVIKKIIRSSLSDLICKGVAPKYYFISACFKKNDINEKNIKLIINALKSEQKKFNIQISGGDTTSSKFTSFSITSVGFSKKVIKRNNALINDDIYVTGNLGDSFVGLNYLKKKYITNKNLKNYFIKKYYIPEIPLSACNLIKKYANTSIDISDGLIDDLNKLINKQKLNFLINLEQIPISAKMKIFLKKNNLKKEKFVFHGDDYQILFTAPKFYRKKIYLYSKKMNQKITIIGKITKYSGKNVLKNNKKPINTTKFKGYTHFL